MHRWLAIAALGTVFLMPSAWGQRRGGGGFGGHGGFASRGSMGGVRGGAMGVRGSGLVGAPRAGVGWGGGFHTGPFGRGGPRCFGCFRPRGYSRYYGYGGYGYPGWGGYGNPGGYSDYAYSQPYYSPYNDSPGYYEQNNQDDRYQQAEIDRLNDEVARLREQRETQASSSSNVRIRTGEELTQLVFLDKHAEEIENYAIVGQTIWVFSEQAARKIPLSALDVPATRKANEDRGVDFSLPH